MKEIALESLQLNPMTMIADDWWLITAGNEENGYNTMTASWGHMGSIWGRPGHGNLPTISVYVRPQRYTKQFMDREELFTLTVFDKQHHKALGYLGTKSGRDEDKVAAVDFHPVFIDGTTGFAEAKLTFVCRKLYRAPILEEGFCDREIVESVYPERDFHDLYIGEIIKVYVED